MTQLIDLDGKAAVVTGGSKGIGRATTELLVECGARGCVLDSDEEANQSLLSELGDNSGRVIVITGDAGDEQAVQASVEAAYGEFESIDIAVANAALGGIRSTASGTTPQSWDRQMAVNLRGPFLLARGCLPAMAANGGGSIVMVSSDCAVRACGGSVAYNTAKTAVIGLARSIAVDYGSRQVRANAVVPGVTRTSGFYEWNASGDRSPETYEASASSVSALGRIGEPEDIARAIVFLCSDWASFVTGSVLTVDGGMTTTYAL